MNIDGIRLFILSAKHLNITRAAEELRLSQSAASRQLKQLEYTLGTQLFRKNGRGRQLTDSGQMFLNRVLPIWLQFEELKEKYNRGPQTVSIGANHRVSKYILPQLIATFSKTHPSARLTLHTRSSLEIEELLSESRVDLAITTNSSLSASLFVTEYYCGEPLLAFVAADHPLARANTPQLSELGARFR